MRQRLLALVLAALASHAVAQTTAAPPTPVEPAEPRTAGDLRLRDFAAKWMVQQDDLAELGRYRAANQALLADPDPRPRVVLMGDSITFRWTSADLPASERLRFVNRGIPGQNTTQMLLRFEDDVIALKPVAMVLLAGTNDLRVYVGEPAAASSSIVERLARNVTAMADIAQARGVKVAICSIPPIGADAARLARDPATLLKANAWLKAFAASRGYPYVDYHGVLAEPSGSLPAQLSRDGLHPTSEGYRLMWPKLEAALAGLGLR